MTDSLPYKYEGEFMLMYHYDVHRWRYDNKFWLSKDGTAWVQTIDGKEDIVGYVTEPVKELIKKWNPIIKKHETINRSFYEHKACRKRSCICKHCDSYCYCYGCDNIIKECKKKTDIGKI